MPIASNSFENLAQQQLLYPLERLARVGNATKPLQVGLPREVSRHEKRIALTPEAVGLLTREGHTVVLESGAGEGAQFSDHEYSETGAKIVYSPAEAFDSEIVLKIDPPTEAEYPLLRKGGTLISALTIPTCTKEFFTALNEKQLTNLAFEFIEDRSGAKPVIRAMSEIAGSTVMLIAAEYLSGVHAGRGVILGGITGVPPTRVVILGAGTVAEYATRTALGLGAEVRVFDKDIYRLQRLRYAIGQQLSTSIIASDTLSEAVRRADVVIGAMRAEAGRSPMIVSDELVSQMQPNTVIIDVSADQGGNFETSQLTSHQNPTFKKHGVIHYGVPNIASRVARTASTALSNIFAPFLIETGTVGGVEAMMLANRWVMKGVYCHKGSLTNAHLAKLFGLRHKDLELLLAVRF